ncbi:MAG TPA: R3H domain-containing nucleic acid-binding protein [Solirubrobacteraceae bacterium]|nr:R3H domain-containing nucleic acid-binding protein [Solirubrobacteraceae bacterium]
MNAAEAEPAERLRELLTRVVDALGVSGSVEVHEDDEWLKATVHGQDLGLLIGRHGETIDALQHLAFRIAYHETEPRKRVAVDASGYRERRAAVLQRQADRAVAEATRSGRPVPLEAMPAAERRLVHEYLRDQSEIETYSEGQEPQRRLVVAPVVS